MSCSLLGSGPPVSQYAAVIEPTPPPRIAMRIHSLRASEPLAYFEREFPADDVPDRVLLDRPVEEVRPGEHELRRPRHRVAERAADDRISLAVAPEAGVEHVRPERAAGVVVRQRSQPALRAARG